MCPVTVDELAAVPLRERVLYVRKKLGLTQVALAARLGVTDRTVKGWESVDEKRGPPDAKNAAALSQMSGVPAWLFMTPPPLELTIAEEINGKLDLLLAHFGLGDPPVPGAEAEAALGRLEENGSAAARSRRVGSRSTAGTS